MRSPKASLRPSGQRKGKALGPQSQSGRSLSFLAGTVFLSLGSSLVLLVLFRDLLFFESLFRLRESIFSSNREKRKWPGPSVSCAVLGFSVTSHTAPPRVPLLLSPHLSPAQPLAVTTWVQADL